MLGIEYDFLQLVKIRNFQAMLTLKCYPRHSNSKGELINAYNLRNS